MSLHSTSTTTSSQTKPPQAGHGHQAAQAAATDGSAVSATTAIDRPALEAQDQVEAQGSIEAPAQKPKAAHDKPIEKWCASPRACLRLFGVRPADRPLHRIDTSVFSLEDVVLPAAELTLEYPVPGLDLTAEQQARHHLSPGDDRRDFRVEHEDRIVVIPRDSEAERGFRRALLRMGWQELNQLDPLPSADYGDALSFAILDPRNRRAAASMLRSARQDGYAFVDVEVPRLRSEGWHVEIEDTWPFGVAQTQSVWTATVQPDLGKDEWFNLELGVEVEGQRVSLIAPLLEILATLSANNPQAVLAEIEALDDEDVLYAPLEGGRAVPLTCGRIKPVLRVLYTLQKAGQVDGRGRVGFRWMQLGELEDLARASAAAELRWHGDERIRAMAQRLLEADDPEEATPTDDFQGELRPYQRQGLAWLQFLGAHRLGGVLADDMGLGKTVQALAHLLVERARLSANEPTTESPARLPSLIVAPTSVVDNWAAEVERFAPSLSTLVLRGADRHEAFGHLAEADLVVTSYALLPRDREHLESQVFDWLILDEAQAIKNPKARVTQLVHQLSARHRLCLTGTPIENHLGELWSLFHFLMPGLLGDSRTFRSRFRNPIEKAGDSIAADLLRKRIRPFVLRRKKEDVLKELPPKTVVNEHVTLHGAQRDLYESVRLSMHGLVRQAVRSQGIARSQIVILDALLRLRQVCCDPRLLPAKAAGGQVSLASSAKLERLEELLETLLDEERRVLVFSQFTSMLKLIEERLRERQWGFVKLTGQSRDRALPVRRFQAGEVPIFLISLKAGGKGLNLTAADTVVHYDPWWNPAVENQATDRAHRIGQQKPVFVHKLVGTGTVEERILDLQERKAALAEGLYDRAGKPAFGEHELEALFTPLSS